MLRGYLISRNIVVGGTTKNPRYELQSKKFYDNTPHGAIRQANDWQADAKIKRWGQSSLPQ